MSNRLLQTLAVCLVAIAMLGATSPDTRVEHLGHKLVCQCGCGQILLECNHVGCPVSPVMIDELKSQVAGGATDTGVLNFFIAKYGPIALAAPMRGGFDNVAWIVPIAVLILATFGVALVVLFWKRRNDNMNPAIADHARLKTDDAIQNRIRRDTNYDNWSDSDFRDRSDK
ncbi:MAG: cytochrome c-type biogenesis protein CcmH [Acidobacteriota bacterium]|nr:cytochrome c-type biogenesis protein CcmH [Acidobacteriota bacterium]